MICPLVIVFAIERARLAGRAHLYLEPLGGERHRKAVGVVIRPLLHTGLCEGGTTACTVDVEIS